MKRPRRRNPLVLALYLNAALLLAVLVALLGRDQPMLPMALGQAQPQIAGGAGLFMMPGQFSANIWGVYLMDVDQQTLAAYSVSGNPPKLTLIAARSFRYDRQLDNFNTGNPTPAEVKDLIEKRAAGNRGVELPAAPQVAPAPPAPAAPPTQPPTVPAR